MNKDEKWMKIALEEAIKAEKEGEVPIGAVLVKDDLLISKAHNQPISKNDATAHAEIQLIRFAGKKLKNYRLNGSTVFVTLQPCSMCIAAMAHARVERIVFGAHDSKLGSFNIKSSLNTETFSKHKITITGGILERDCRELLLKFFKSRR